jgi:hypothetical protein
MYTHMALSLQTHFLQDEIERDLFDDTHDWVRLGKYVGVFVEQEDAFVDLIDGTHPSSSPPDASAREAMQFEAQSMFVALEDLSAAAKGQKVKSAQRAYADLAWAYDRFLKAGDMYLAYDPITSTEIFYKDFTPETFRYDECCLTIHIHSPQTPTLHVSVTASQVREKCATASKGHCTACWRPGHGQDGHSSRRTPGQGHRKDSF